MDKKNIAETKSIAENFDKYFTPIVPNSAKFFFASTKGFNEYINKYGTTQLEKVIPLNEFKDAF